MTRREQKNKQKGLRRSIIIHLILLLIFFLYSFTAEKPNEPYDKPPYPVMVDFTFEESSLSTYAHANVGRSRPKTEELTKVETSQPKEVEITKPDIELPDPTPVPNPTPTEPVVTETTVDESPVEAVESEVEIDDPIEEDIPVENPTPPTVDPPKTSKSDSPIKITKPGSDSEGSSDKMSSQTDGDGQGKGDTGDGKGSDSGNDNTSGKGNSSDGTGVYDGSGYGIFGRSVIKRNYKAIPMTKKGKIVVKTCINRAGSVTFAEIMEEGTTITDRALLKKTLSASYGYKFEPDMKAPKEQCGKLIISLSGNAIPGIR